MESQSLFSPSVTTVPNEKSSVFDQLRDFRSNIPKELLAQWEKPTGVGSILSLAQDWAILLAGHQLYVLRPGVASFIVAIILMAWGHRGISNLAHDAIHRNLAKSKIWNDFMADVFLAPPLMSTAQLQRQAHSAHHHYLGTKDDPDHGLDNDTSLKHYRNGRFDHTSIFSLFLYDFFDHKAFFQHTVGSLAEAPLHLTLWWMVIAVLAGSVEPGRLLLFGSVPIGWQFLMLFHTAHCTLTYGVYILREIIDHSGLPPTTILSFTRTSPGRRAFQRFIQPHDDNYHLLHHLLPRVPMSKLHTSHEWLVENVDIYAIANRHTEYFTGENPLFTQSLHNHAATAVVPLMSSQ